MEFLELFDGPQVFDCYDRTWSVVPQQALVLANSDLSLSHARKLARRLWQEVREEDTTAHEASFIRAAFEQVLSRLPSQQEQELTREFLKRQRNVFVQAADSTASASTAEGQGGDSASSEKGAAALVEPSSDTAMRARESLVHSLLNHNDFLTIR